MPRGHKRKNVALIDTEINRTEDLAEEGSVAKNGILCNLGKQTQNVSKNPASGKNKQGSEAKGKTFRNKTKQTRESSQDSATPSTSMVDHTPPESAVKFSNHSKALIEEDETVMEMQVGEADFLSDGEIQEGEGELDADVTFRSRSRSQSQLTASEDADNIMAESSSESESDDEEQVVTPEPEPRKRGCSCTKHQNRRSSSRSRSCLTSKPKLIP